MLAATDWGEYGVFPAKYERLRCSDTTAKSWGLKVLLGSLFYWKNGILQGSKRIDLSLL